MRPGGGGPWRPFGRNGGAGGREIHHLGLVAALVLLAVVGLVTEPDNFATSGNVVGILALAVSTWLLAPQAIAAIGLVATPDLGLVAEAAISAAVPASLVLALGAVASRIAWLLVLAIPVLAVHGLLLVVVAMG